MRRILTALALMLSFASVASSNDFYNHGSFPTTGSAATSAAMRAELDLIGAGFDKLPLLTGNASKPVIINGSATGLGVTTGTLALGGNFAISGAFATTLTVTAATGVTLPTTGTLATLAGTETFTNKTLTLPIISSISNTGTLTLPTSTDTLVGRATTDTLTNKTLTAPVIATISNAGTLTLPSSTDTLVGRATTDTLTNKTVSLGSNTFSGTTAQFNAALNDNDFATLAGAEALTNKTINGSSNTITNVPLRSYLAGYTMSTAGSSTTMTIAAGQATDSTNVQAITLASSLAKLASPWGVGASGCLDTGGIANSTWYHFYAILRTDTGVVDILCSLSASAPTMPASYSYKRRIGSAKTDGSGNWVAFTQDGDFFQWSALVADISATNPGASAVTRTLTVPTGVNVMALVNLSISVGSTIGAAYLSDLAVADASPGVGVSQAYASVASSASSAPVTVRTNTSAQIRSRLSGSDGSSVLTIGTVGWWDRRERDS